MQRIIVGADGSAGSANAMRWAAHLAAGAGAELVVMTGFVPKESELPPQRVDALLGELDQQLQQWSTAARTGSVDVRTIIERGDPREGILRVAEREQADLIVVGRVGQSAGPGLFHIGSMAEWLAHNATIPTAVVGGAVNIATASVLVGVDGSPGSAAALAWLVDLAGALDVRVVAATVHQPYLEWTPPSHPDNWRRDVEQQIREEFAADLTNAGIEFEALALRGSNAADVLLQAAQDERTDLIVIGARGLGGFRGLRIGGVALKLLHRADRPVVIVPLS